MPSDDVELTRRLADELGRSEAADFVGRLTLAHVRPASVLPLLDELEAASGKIARAAIEALPELERRAGCAQLVSWLDLGVALAGSSGAIALRYFKDSPIILGVMGGDEQRHTALAVALELAEQDSNVAWEYLKASPHIMTVVAAADVPRWLEIGIELTQSDPVVGLEYIKQIPSVASVVSLDTVRDWLAFGLKLVVPNAFGKPDYLGTMEYLRTSASLLGSIEAPLRPHVISLGSLLATAAPAAGIAWLAEAPGLLRALPSSNWRLKMLQYGALLAERDHQAALSYLRRSPELIGLLPDESSAYGRFENWFKAGMDVLSYSPEAGRAYYAAESRTALTSVEEALSGVPLRQVARTIKLFVQGLCGREVTILAESNTVANTVANTVSRASLSPDRKTLTLPALLRRYATAEQNERLYLVMAAHEAGHVEFGTYTLSMDQLTDLAATVCRRYGLAMPPALQTLSELFRLYPQPRLVEDLWTILEDARVEHLLGLHYPGLRADLAQLAAERNTVRDPAHALTVRELVVDCLLRLSAGASFDTAVPHAVTNEVSILWELCRPVLTVAATAEDAVRTADHVYARLEELVAGTGRTSPEPAAPDTPDRVAGAPATEQGAGEYRAVENFFYRGRMTPDLSDQRIEQQTTLQANEERRRSPEGFGERREQPDAAGEALAGARSLPSVVDELLAIDLEAQPTSDDGGSERVYRYPEWDHRLQDHRVNWCRVIARAADRGSDDPVSGTLTAHRSTVRLLRRAFEALRPPAVRRLAGQPDGEDLDIDAVVRRTAEQRAGWEGTDRIYIRHEKRERDVAVAFLIDVSGSTGRQLEGGRRVIDVEKESLVLLCEALDAVGDQYALYAYSGQGRGFVEVHTIKEFEEPLGTSTAQRLGGLAPRQQNRDGAAIRHATSRLRQRNAKARLLVLLSDGRPLDGDYKDEYALEDTKAALAEARREGIHPFCVTIDREADGYVRRMYGQVEYTVIDRVESLPRKLPRIYQRLAT